MAGSGKGAEVKVDLNPPSPFCELGISQIYLLTSLWSIFFINDCCGSWRSELGSDPGGGENTVS